LEYMAAGLPIIYPRIGDLPGLVGDAGFAYPAGDVAAMTDRLGQLLSDPLLGPRLGRLGIERAQRRSWSVVAGEVTDALQAAVGSRTAGVL
jgi:glycosyltransferase involved in cell wall biosynthesis